MVGIFIIHMNAAKPLSLVKSCGSELHRLIIHCVKIVFPFIISKRIAFHTNCMSSVLVLLCSLFEGMIYFHPSKCYFFIYFFHPLYSSSFYVTLPQSSYLSPFRSLYWLLIIFATLSVPTVSVWRQSCCSQTQMGLTPVCPRLQSDRIK